MWNHLLYILTPVFGTLATIGLFVLMCVAINVLLKTSVGTRIKNATPWMGWFEDVDDDYTEFTIHRSNYIRVPSSH